MSGKLEDYEYLSNLTGQMRGAAEQGEWDNLVGLEKQCSERVQVMKAQPTQAEIDEEARLRKVAMIKKILADDAAIRNKTEVWMDQLQRIMHSARSEQRLKQAYSGGQ